MGKLPIEIRPEFRSDTMNPHMPLLIHRAVLGLTRRKYLHVVSAGLQHQRGLFDVSGDASSSCLGRIFV